MCVSVRCTRDDAGMLCPFSFLVLIVIFVSLLQTDTALGGPLRTLKARVHRPLDHPPVTVHQPRGNRQGDPARRVQATLCQRTSYTGAFPNISHFSSTNCSEVMSKRTQKDSSEERVPAKSKRMMNLVSRCSERTPDVLPSTASECPVKTRYETQLL